MALDWPPPKPRLVIDDDWIDSITIAYLAGFFDGEGSVWARNGLQVTVTQISREPLEVFRSTFGGAIHGPYATQKSPTSQWAIYGTGATATLTRLAPYLIVKREQVAAALEYAELVRPLGDAHNGLQLDPETKAKREALRQRISRDRTGSSHRREGGE